MLTMKQSSVREGVPEAALSERLAADILEPRNYSARDDQLRQGSLGQAFSRRECGNPPHIGSSLDADFSERPGDLRRGNGLCAAVLHPTRAAEKHGA